MASKPKYSIVLPTYNRARFLDAAIDSVLAQSVNDWELVIVDDGSTDNTREIALRYKDERIKYYYQENLERSAARNNGIKRASGAFIAFLDSDDIYLPNHLEEAEKLIQSTSEEALYVMPYIMDDREDRRVCNLPKSKHALLKRLTWNNPISILGVIVPKQLMLRYPFPEGRAFKVGEDLYVWLRILCETEIVAGNVATSIIGTHTDRTMSSPSPEVFLESCDQMVAGLKSDPRLSPYLRIVKANYLSLVALAFAMHGSKGKAFNYMIKAIVTNTGELAKRRVPAILKHILMG